MQHLEPVDLLHHIRLGLNALVGGLDPTGKHMPYWSFNMKDGQLRPLVHQGAWEWCHDVARALHGLNTVEQSTGERVEEAIWRDLADLQIALFDEADDLPGAPDDSTGKRFVHLHNIREATHGLTGLIRRGDERARTWSRRMIRAVRRALDENGTIHPERLPPYVADYNYQPSQEGRAVDALVRHYRQTEDPVALELAGLMTHYALDHCFSPEGRIKEEAGNHGHSINALVAGMADLALITGNADMLRRVKAIYDVGCPRFNSSFGWSMESLDRFTGRGESNNTGDLLRAALILGQAGWPQYFEHAERILRGHLLPSQVIEVDDFAEEADAQDGARSGLASRLRGGFGFPTPNDFLASSEAGLVVYDITSGAVDGLCEALNAAITLDQAAVRVNLLLSHEAHDVRVTSHLSKEGRVEMENRSGRNLLVRIPSWVAPEDVSLTVNGSEHDKVFVNSYLLVPPKARLSSCTISFPMRDERTTELICFTKYTIGWRGDQILAMSPVAEHRPMFPACE